MDRTSISLWRAPPSETSVLSEHPGQEQSDQGNIHLNFHVKPRMLHRATGSWSEQWSAMDRSLVHHRADYQQPFTLTFTWANS